MHNITNQATTSGLTADENKIPSVSNLVKKSDYNTKIKEIKNKKNYDKYITIPEFNKFTATKTDFDNKLKDVISNKN